MGSSSSDLNNNQSAKSPHSSSFSTQDNFKTLLDGIKFLETKVEMQTKATKIDQRSSQVLKYKTPQFRARSRIAIPAIHTGETWQIGWVQACTHMTFVNTYGNYGSTSWEFPHITSSQHTLVSDSDGSSYPWYGPGTEMEEIQGPRSESQIVIEMCDNFHPHVTWTLPIPTKMGEQQITSDLTRVYRHQTFYTWVVLKNCDTDECYPLKCFKWEMKVDIEVDPEKPLGARAKLISTSLPKQPKEIPITTLIPLCALNPPNCNGNQNLIFRDNAGRCLTVIPSKSGGQSINNNPCVDCKDFLLSVGDGN